MSKVCDMLPPRREIKHKRTGGASEKDQMGRKESSGLIITMEVMFCDQWITYTDIPKYQMDLDESRGQQ